MVRVGSGAGEFERSVYVVGNLGEWVSPDVLSREWRTVSRALGIVGTEGRVPTFHDLRHTFATAAVNAPGVSVKTVAGILGHSNAAMTLNIYAADDLAVTLASAESIGAALRGGC